jgi:hypothetical protein
LVWRIANDGGSIGKRFAARRQGAVVQGSSNVQEAKLEAINSHTGLKAIEYILVAAPATLLLSVYLFGSLVIRSQFDVPKACRVNAQTEYAAPRG